MGKKRETSDKEHVKQKKIVDEIFEDVVDELKHQTNNRRAAKIYDMIGPVLKRRKEAVTAMMDTVCKRYKDKCPDIDVERNWAIHCSSFGHTVDGIDSIYHISLAAALWILDALEQSGKFRKAEPFLELDKEQLDSIDLPEFTDPLYDEMTVRGMVYLVQNRDIRDNPYQWYISPFSAKRQEPEAYESIPEGTEISSLSPRQRLNALLAMIDPKLIGRTVKRFEDKYWEFLDLVFEGTQEHAEKAMRFEKQLSIKMDQLKEHDEDFHTVGSFLNVKADPALGMLSDPNSRKNSIVDTLKIGEKMDQERERSSAFLNMSHMVLMEDRKWIETFADVDIDRLQAFGVKDPYETCFAYMCLLDAGSDIPWTYTPASAVLQAAARKLPWTVFVGESDLDEDLWQELPSADVDESDAAEASITTEQLLNDIKQNGVKDWIEKKEELYRLKYEDNSLYFPKKSPAEDWKVNLAQIVYGNTKLLMPRNVFSFDEYGKDLARDGMDSQMAQTMELYFQLAEDCTLGHIYQTPVMEETSEDAGMASEQSLKTMESEKDDHDSLQMLQQELKDTKADLNRMRRALHDMERTIVTAQKESEKYRSMAEDEMQELANLRELIYLQANEQSNTEPQNDEPEICFPYTPSRKIAIFGGHETWLKVIRPMLPGVTFVPKGQTPNVELIRSQDVIWIQANAMAHSDFFKLINTIRTDHIPVRYFGFASARKCAEQLVKDEENIS